MGTFGTIEDRFDLQDPSGAANFGPFTVNFRNQSLHKHGIRLKVSPQAFRVLICLIERAPNVVEREQLFELLWPGDTHVDFTGNLNAIIRDLRILLGDSARSPRYIETELRRGYRFIAPLDLPKAPPKRGADEVFAATTVVPASGNPNRPKALMWLSIFGLCLLGLTAIGSFRQWLGTHLGTERPVPRIVQLTSLSGRAGHASLSPDGKRVAFHWDGAESGKFNIYSTELGSEQFVRLTNAPADDLYPAWSPDGRDIAFLRRFPDGKCSIYLIPSEGGSERLIRDVPTESSLSWSSDGRWLAYTVLYTEASTASSPDFGVYAVSLLSGRVVRLTVPPKSFIGDADGTFSPDGRHLAFFRSSSMGLSKLYVQDLDQSKNPIGPPKQITSEGENARFPAWTPDGRRIVFSSLRGGVRSLWQVPFRERAEAVPIGGENAQQPVFDPAGNRILYERITVNDTLQLLPLCASGTCASGPLSKLRYSREVARNPSWSPDGTQIAFESSEQGRVQVWRCNRDGSSAQVVSSFQAPLSGTPRWSPDGSRLVMDSSVAGHSKIFLVDVSGTGVRQLTRGDWEDVTPSFSHDGSTVYFASNRTGEFQVWKLRLANGVVTQVTRHGGFYALESTDCRWLLYAKGSYRTAIAKVPVDGGEERTVIPSLSYWPAFTVSSRGIYFVPTKSDKAGVSICFHPFSEGKDSVVTTVPGVDVQGMALSPNGRELLVSLRNSAETNLMALTLAGTTW